MCKQTRHLTLGKVAVSEHGIVFKHQIQKKTSFEIKIETYMYRKTQELDG